MKKILNLTLSGVLLIALFIFPEIFKESIYPPVEKTYLKNGRGFPSLLSTIL